MEASTDQHLDQASIPFNVRVVQFQSPTQPCKDGIFPNIRIVKPNPLTRQSSYTTEQHDDETVNRQKVIRLDPEDIHKSQTSNEVGQILNVHVKSLKKNISVLSGYNGKNGLCFPQVYSNSNQIVAPSSSVFQPNVKPKTQEVSKVIQDITEDWNSDPQGRSEKVHHCHLDKEVSKADVQAILSDANLATLDRGTFGMVCISRKTSSLVVKMTAQPVNANEVLVPLKLKDCPNILQVYAVDVRKGLFCIVQEHCGASLKMLVRDSNFQNFFRNVTKRHGFIEGMFRGVEVLEKSMACHGDLKLENICARLENDIFVPRLIDFGTCQVSSDKPSLEGISPEFLPPKVNSFALQLLQKCIEPEEQKMLLFNEKSDSWSVAIVTVCLWLNGMHPIKEVQSYVTFDLPERINAMRKIAQLSDEAVDDLIPSDLDKVVKTAVRANLRVRADERWGAQKTLNHFRQARLQEGSLSQGDVNLKRGKKRPVSPFHPSSGYRNDDDVTELMDLFNSFHKKKSPEQISAPIIEPPDCEQDKSMNPKYFAVNIPATQVAIKPGGLISTLKFKPHHPLGEVKVQRNEGFYPHDSLSHTVSLSRPSGVAPDMLQANIPDITKLEAAHSHDLEKFKVKAVTQKVVQPKDEVHLMGPSSSAMPDFGLLGMDWDMNNDPPVQNSSHKVAGRSSRRRGSTKSKSIIK